MAHTPEIDHQIAHHHDNKHEASLKDSMRICVFVEDLCLMLHPIVESFVRQVMLGCYVGSKRQGPYVLCIVGIIKSHIPPVCVTLGVYYK
jgi:hypothetical protein